MTDKYLPTSSPDISYLNPELDTANVENTLENQLTVVRIRLAGAIARRDEIWSTLPKGQFAPPNAVLHADHVEHLVGEVKLLEKRLERRDKWARRRRQIGEITDSFRN